MFVAVGDHECDRAPLQISQFESSDEKLDHWLQSVYLEGGGGGNDGESYFLPWMFTKAISTDHWEKRGKKGILITIGDEKCLPSLGSATSKKIFGVERPISAIEALEEARKQWKVFHLHIRDTMTGSRSDVQSFWKEYDLDGLEFISKNDVAETIGTIVAKHADVEGVAYASPLDHTQANTPGALPEDVPVPEETIRPVDAANLEEDVPVPDEVKDEDMDKATVDDLPEPM